ncbi:MAG: carbon storage regulator CsrA [Planctomycetaceae bacterium]|jgi:carbon storage regulator|nr:carbon storage regulator CsrA [Planctomycetaceae bacterium]
MLVLSRYRDESIIIGDDVVVTVVDVRGDRVRIGIQAPPNVTVHRREVYDAISNDRKNETEGKPTPTITGQPETFGIPFGTVSQ